MASRHACSKYDVPPPLSSAAIWSPIPNDKEIGREEAFSDVSSRTYMSTLERDLKSPTLNKLAELCEVMEIHPLTLLTLAYAGDSPRKADELLAQVRQELEAVLSERDAAKPRA